MKYAHICKAPLTAVLLVVAALTAPAAAEQSHHEDEQAIRRAVETFVKSYNAGDAKTLAALFAADGEIVNEAGETRQGRETIERVFADIFRRHPKSRIEVAVRSIRFIGPALAIEDGASTVVQQPGAMPELSRYAVVHVKQDGDWRMASARDLPDGPASAEEELKQLAWLVGEWVDESPAALVVTRYRWSDDRRAILSEFKVQVGGRAAMTGSQRITWDPLRGQLHSWMFDSEGGFTEGLWARDGNRWIIKMTGTTREGKPASATNVITQATKDRMTWQSRDRVIGGETLANIAEIPIVRKPPEPSK